MTWETVIGLEVHAQLKTQSKLFSSASTTYGAAPNTQTNYIDAGLPGVLPVLNKSAIAMAIQFGLAINAKVNLHTYFERKNYFYPDLPKGYQISQFQHPIVSDGHLDIKLSNGSKKQIVIQRAHLEEDAGKSIHDASPKYTGIDLNRAGTPLLEIVTTPCIYSAEEAVLYLKTLHQLVRFLGICDGNMQEGSFRCDVNISLRRTGDKNLGVRTELKNLNSFRFIEKAIQYEEERHQESLEAGHPLTQETRLYNPDKNITEPMRSKENEKDYRYFPDPDLLPIQITEDEIRAVEKTLPPLPEAILRQLIEHALSDEYIEFILSSPTIYDFYRNIQENCKATPKIIVTWLKGHYAAALNEKSLSFEDHLISPERFADLLNRVTDNSIPSNSAKKVFQQMLDSSLSIDEIMTALDLNTTQNTDEIEALVIDLLKKFPDQAAEFRSGKDKLITFFVGQVMKQTKGKADPAVVNQLLQQYLYQS